MNGGFFQRKWLILVFQPHLLIWTSILSSFSLNSLIWQTRNRWSNVSSQNVSTKHGDDHFISSQIIRIFLPTKKKSCASMIRKCTVTCPLTKTWLPWTTLSSKSLYLKNQSKQRKQLGKFWGGFYISKNFFVKEERARGDKGTTPSVSTLVYSSLSTASIPPKWLNSDNTDLHF